MGIDIYEFPLDSIKRNLQLLLGLDPGSITIAKDRNQPGLKGLSEDSCNLFIISTWAAWLQHHKAGRR